MVAKFVSLFMLMGSLSLASVGNFWFTFGIWPKSWVSMVVFWLITFVLLELMKLVAKE